jgi:plastocyanin
MMPMIRVLLCLLPALAAAAEIEGRIELPKLAVAPVTQPRYEIVATADVLAPTPPVAVVYLEGAFPPPAQPATVQLAQKDMTFVPALLPIRTGTRVEFPNLDEFYHNVFSFSAPKRFDLGRYRPDDKPVPSQVFDKPGLITLRCEIHENMRGLILVLDTPYFVVTDTSGHFRLTDLPSGRFVLKAWIDSKTTRSQPVEIPAAGVLRADFP